MIWKEEVFAVFTSFISFCVFITLQLFSWKTTDMQLMHKSGMNNKNSFMVLFFDDEWRVINDES